MIKKKQKKKTILHQSEEAYSYYIRPMPDSTIWSFWKWSKNMNKNTCIFLGGGGGQIFKWDKWTFKISRKGKFNQEISWKLAYLYSNLKINPPPQKKTSTYM